MTRRAWFILLLGLASCSPAEKGGNASSSDAGASAPVASSAALAPSSGAPEKPELSKIREELAPLKRIEGSAVGYGATPGGFYQVSLLALSTLGPEDFEKLAGDAKPVVRAMGWLGLALRPTAKTNEILLAHLHDGDLIDLFPGGCVGGEIQLGAFARKLLRDPSYLGHELNGTLPTPSLVDESMRFAIDLEILASDELEPMHFESASALAESFDSGALKFDRKHLFTLGERRGLTPWAVVKAVGRASDASPNAAKRRLAFLIDVLCDQTAPSAARLAAASALTRFTEPAAREAVERHRAFFGTVLSKGTAERLVAASRERQEHERRMKPFRETHTLAETEPLADDAIRALASVHPMAIKELMALGSFGKHDDRVWVAKVNALGPVVEHLADEPPCWSTYSDVEYLMERWLQGEYVARTLTEEKRAASLATLDRLKKQGLRCP